MDAGAIIDRLPKNRERSYEICKTLRLMAINVFFDDFTFEGFSSVREEKPSNLEGFFLRSEEKQSNLEGFFLRSEQKQ